MITTVKTIDSHLKVRGLHAELGVSFTHSLLMNNHVHRALLENTERMRKEKDKKGNAQKRLTLLNK